MLNPIPTEVTTAATDVVLALEAIVCVALLRSFAQLDAFKVRLWFGIFGLLFIASVLGAIAHGLEIGAELREILWQPLFLSLGLMLGLIAVAAVYDRWGPAAGRRVFPLALITGVVFYGVTVVAEGSFLVFVAYEAVAMIFALVVYFELAFRGRAGAALIAAGVVLTLIAAVVQQTDWTVTLVWPLDHNGIFHLIQMPGVLLIALGVRKSLSDTERPLVPAL